MQDGKYWDVVDQFDDGIESIALSLRHYCAKEDLVYAILQAIWLNSPAQCKTLDNDTHVIVSVDVSTVEARVFLNKNMDVEIIHRMKIGE